MTILELLRKEAADGRRRILVSAGLAGGANALVLGFANLAAENPGDSAVRSFVMFVLAVAIYGYGARYTYNRLAEIVQNALLRIKIRIVDRVERAELEQLERIGVGEINDRITENMTIISDSSGLLANLLQSVCILLFATLYLVSLSAPAFVMMVFVLGTGMTVYMSMHREVREHLMRAAQKRLVFFETLMDLLGGFKEVKFSRRRGSDLRKEIVETGEALRDSTLKAAYMFNDHWIFANILLFALIGALVFVLPAHAEVDASTVKSLVAAGMFIWGPVGGVVGGFPAYVRCNVALGQIETLEAKLASAIQDTAPGQEPVDPWKGAIQAIQAEDIEYEYPTEKGNGNGGSFRIGPMSLSVSAGEVLFIVGGNGSGKSTFLKVLTGLYPPTRGRLSADGIPVRGKNVAVYREQISAIFSDFHLFAKLYGLLGTDEAEVQPLLVQMQLEDKTAFKADRFTRRNLSTGQKKRLAMIVALLEDRPIYVFDEWPADQDPEFRKYFYEELLPELQKKGKTVIAVSHDDRYFHCADRVVKLADGKILSIEAGAALKGRTKVGGDADEGASS
ncbi:cyclic peptide export ABC transporter [Chondromyces crocatus]|uniref:ABC transporter ATP-binding protein n=1 Tax=Chondromyces crocatus TaxID=52 RepID=A0A0K1EK36_CHOCO|nr:cyclic peptide export ABC transporter [Chondromyces crocatus]AKT41221.1 ABC transporter ATP-binding protein [Chondromyces crocatus]